jgi:signal transduction histidine kinase
VNQKLLSGLMKNQISVIEKHLKLLTLSAFLLLSSPVWANVDTIPVFSVDTQGVVEIDVDWLYVPNKLLNGSEQLSTDSGALVGIPHDMSKNGLAQYGTYLIRLEIDKTLPVTDWAIFTTRIKTSNAIYFNGKLAGARGTVSDSIETSVPLYQNNYVKIPQDANSIVVAIQVSNYIHLKSGIDGSVRIGSQKIIFKQFVDRILLQTSVAAISIIMGLYLFVFYLARWEDRSLLFFSLFAISVGIRQMVLGEKILMFIFPEINQTLVIIFDYMSPQIACSFLIAYAYNTALEFSNGKVTESCKRIYILLVTSPMIFPLTGLLFGGSKGLVLVLPLFSIGIASMAYYYLRSATVLRRSGHLVLSILFYLNGLFVTFLALWDILVATSIIQGPLLATYGLTGFVFGQAVLATIILLQDRKRALEVSDELFRLNTQLEDSNFTLEHRVEEQTELFRSDAARFSKIAASYARLSSSVTKGRELELTYLTQEVHDVLSAPMLVTSHTLADVSARIRDYDSELSTKLVNTAANLTNAYSQFRGVLHKSRPASLDVLYLEQILRQDLNVLISLRPLISVTQSTKYLTIAAKTNVFRIAQEALANTIKYAKATIFSIEITDQEKDGRSGWGIRIEDDGEGAEIKDLQLNGLLGVQNRFEELLGGSVSFDGNPNEGFLIVGWIPKEINSLSLDVS